MKWRTSFALAFASLLLAAGSASAQCNHSSGGRSTSSPGSFGALNSQQYSYSNSPYYNYSGAAYIPTAGEALAYNQQAMYRAMLSQRMDRLMQMETVNQIAAQRAALRNAQKARKEAKKQDLLTAGR